MTKDQMAIWLASEVWDQYNKHKPVGMFKIEETNSREELIRNILAAYSEEQLSFCYKVASEHYWFVEKFMTCVMKSSFPNKGKKKSALGAILNDVAAKVMKEKKVVLSKRPSRTPKGYVVTEGREFVGTFKESAMTYTGAKRKRRGYSPQKMSMPSHGMSVKLTAEDLKQLQAKAEELKKMRKTT